MPAPPAPDAAEDEAPGLRVARWVPATTAEGPFLRTAIWVQGCPIRCPGCCNPELFDPVGGETVGPGEARERLAHAARGLGVEGITVVGGEPLAQPEAVAALARQAARIGLGVILYTGYDLRQIERAARLRAALRHADTVVAGPYRAAWPERERAFVGSANQILLHRTDRYRDPALWSRPARAEVRIGPGRTEIVGLPQAVDAVARLLTRGRPRA